MTGDPSLGDVRHGGSLLYLCSNRAEFAGQMPLFDEWGLRPVGLVGPRETPVIVAPFLTACTELAPGVGAGRQASLEAGDSSVMMPTPHGVPGASSFRACEAHPEAVVDGGTQPAAPEAGAPKALVNLHEASTEVSTWSGTPEVASSGVAPSTLGFGDRAQGFGRLRPNFMALHKRRGVSKLQW